MPIQPNVEQEVTAMLREVVRALRARTRPSRASDPASALSTDVGASYPHRVTYHASCHGLRGLALYELEADEQSGRAATRWLNLPEHMLYR